jgi:hypothetical protein
MAPKHAEDVESLEYTKGTATSDADLVPDAGKVHLGTFLDLAVLIRVVARVVARLTST